MIALRWLVAAAICAALTAPGAAQAPGNQPSPSIRPSPSSKAALADRLRALQTRYDAIKAASPRLAPARPTDPIATIRDRRQLATTARDADQLMRELDSEKAKLDSMGDLSQEQQLKMQMAMDRMSKAMSTLSNLLKKLDQTNDSIIQNLK